MQVWIQTGGLGRDAGAHTAQAHNRCVTLSNLIANFWSEASSRNPTECLEIVIMIIMITNSGSCYTENRINTRLWTTFRFVEDSMQHLSKINTFSASRKC